MIKILLIAFIGIVFSTSVMAVEDVDEIALMMLGGTSADLQEFKKFKEAGAFSIKQEDRKNKFVLFQSAQQISTVISFYGKGNVPNGVLDAILKKNHIELTVLAINDAKESGDFSRVNAYISAFNGLQYKPYRVCDNGVVFDSGKGTSKIINQQLYSIYLSKHKIKSTNDVVCINEDGHNSGFLWALGNELNDEKKCVGNSKSFIAGCVEYVRSR